MTAISEEAVSVRNLIPEEPGWDVVNANATTVEKFLVNQLRAGFSPALQVEVAARKPGHDVRPIPYWGTLERVSYRALTEAILRDEVPVDRSPQAYQTFATEPGRYARDRQDHKSGDDLDLFFWGLGPVNYVVKSDIAAFYQFIDHSILAEELLLLGGDFELITALMELLSETQGRSYGIPQLLDASDMLSDVYADRIERQLLRAGYATWRFNDDFRIACDTYEEALAAIEELDMAARESGLVLAEGKTVTVGLFNYISDVFDLEPSESGQAVALDDVEDLLGDYTDDFGEEDADAALAVLHRAQVKRSEVRPKSNSPHWIKLKSLRLEDVRLLRRAINGLVVAGDPRAVPEVVRLAIYAPSLTPNLMRDLRSVGSKLEPDDPLWLELGQVAESFATDVSLNAWQNLWLLELIRELNLLNRTDSLQNDSNLILWVDALRRDTINAALRAVATRTMAAAGLLLVEDVVAAAERASEALLHIYTDAGLKSMSAVSGSAAARSEKVLAAWGKSSKLHACLLGDA